MHEELREKLKKIEKNYNGKDFQAIIHHAKTNRIKDDSLLAQIESISLKNFIGTNRITMSVPAGNSLEILGTLIAFGIAIQINSEWIFYISTLVLMATLHPLSHYLAGALYGIRFTHYYLNGPARVEPTLRIDYSSYLKANGGKRAIMHLSGVIGTVAAPLIAAFLAFEKGEPSAAFNLVIIFLFLIVFELLTSTKIGDLMKAKREYGFR